LGGGSGENSKRFDREDMVEIGGELPAEEEAMAGFRWRKGRDEMRFPSCLVWVESKKKDWTGLDSGSMRKEKTVLF